MHLQRRADTCTYIHVFLTSEVEKHAFCIGGGNEEATINLQFCLLSQNNIVWGTYMYMQVTKLLSFVRTYVHTLMLRLFHFCDLWHFQTAFYIFWCVARGLNFLTSPYSLCIQCVNTLLELSSFKWVQSQPTVQRWFELD